MAASETPNAVILGQLEDLAPGYIGSLLRTFYGGRLQVILVDPASHLADVVASILHDASKPLELGVGVSEQVTAPGSFFGGPASPAGQMRG
jgi:hypothetical protein